MALLTGAAVVIRLAKHGEWLSGSYDPSSRMDLSSCLGAERSSLPKLNEGTSARTNNLRIHGRLKDWVRVTKPVAGNA